jgi:hypothetical protein
MRGLPVYCDELLFDFDNHDPTEFKAWLKEQNITHKEFTSGYRSVHLHIPIVSIHGDWVPLAIKQWAKKHAPTVDMSYIHPAGVFRLPGTYHPKNPGHFKQLVFEHEGHILTIPEPEEKVMSKLRIQADTTPEQLWIELMSKKGPGHRSGHLWKIATLAFELGYDMDQTIEFMCQWNTSMADPPQDEHTILRQAESAWERIQRRQG